jgi:hypothetical protein
MDLIKAHQHSSNNLKEIEASSICGCFYCEKTFSPDQIEKWIDKGRCAICPFCFIDSVIGDKSELPVTEPNFLKQMHDFWFKNEQTRTRDS